MKKLLFSMLFVTVFLTACNDDSTEFEDEEVYDEGITEEVEESPYTEEELESEPSAPSTSTDDYNSNGEYVPENGVSDNPADYNSDGEYKPVEDMTQNEIEAELEEILGDSLGK